MIMHADARRHDGTIIRDEDTAFSPIDAAIGASTYRVIDRLTVRVPQGGYGS